MRHAVACLAALAAATGATAFAPQSSFVARTPALRATSTLRQPCITCQIANGVRTCVQVSVAPLRMSLQHERKNGPLQNMVRQAAVYPVAERLPSRLPG